MPPVKMLLLHCRTGCASSVPQASLGFQPLLAALSFPGHSPVGNCEVAPGASFLERRLRDGGPWEGTLYPGKQSLEGSDAHRHFCVRAVMCVCIGGFLLVLFLS